MSYVKYKLHHDTATSDVSVRISAIANGWVIKAGDVPYFCETEDEVIAAVSDLLKAYLKETCK
jgi:hypothetical protein